jgi:hypothetical protein
LSRERRACGAGACGGVRRCTGRSRCGAGGGAHRCRCSVAQGHSHQADACAGRFIRAGCSFLQARWSRPAARSGPTDTTSTSTACSWRNRICAPEGARWACGQRAFIAMRGLLEGQSISCSFIAAAGSPKAACWVGDTDVTQWLLSQGWAELAEGVTDETYADAAASARRRKAGIWGDGPPPAGQNMEQLHLNVARLDRVITGGLPPAPQLRCIRQVSPAARNREQSASATWRLPASIRMRVQIGAAFILTVVVRITLG